MFENTYVLTERQTDRQIERQTDTQTVFRPCGLGIDKHESSLDINEQLQRFMTDRQKDSLSGPCFSVTFNTAMQCKCDLHEIIKIRSVCSNSHALDIYSLQLVGW